MFLRHIILFSFLTALCGCDTLQSVSNPFRSSAQQRAEPQERLSASPAASRPVSASAAWRVPNDQSGSLFTFVVDSDPSGADLFQVGGGKTNLLGKTPVTFPLIIERDRSNPFYFLMPRQWVARGNPTMPLTFIHLQHAILIQTPELHLQSDGHDPQRFTHRWALPADLKGRDFQGRARPLPRQHYVTAVLRRPNTPQSEVKIIIDSFPRGLQLYTLNTEGDPGAFIGTTPVEQLVGFAAIRAEDGTITGWRRWIRPGAAGLWTHGDDGALLLSAALVGDGYEPERIVNRPVAQFGQDAGVTKTLQFRLTRPLRAEAEMRLHVDSLPSGAEVYLLREDGSMGQRLGTTPFFIDVGLGQELVEASPNNYVHRDWAVWAPEGLIQWASDQNGRAEFFLTCAVYKEGFAIEQVNQSIFTLQPGAAFPGDTVLTIPLFTPEQAAARESRRLRELELDWSRQRSAPTREAGRSPGGFIWQAPEPQSQRPAPRILDDDPVTEPDSWWSRTRQRLGLERTSDEQFRNR